MERASGAHSSSGFHQYVLGAFPQQAIRKVFVGLIGQDHDGRGVGAGMHIQEGIEQRGAVGQA